MHLHRCTLSETMNTVSVVFTIPHGATMRQRMEILPGLGSKDHNTIQERCDNALNLIKNQHHTNHKSMSVSSQKNRLF